MISYSSNGCHSARANSEYLFQPGSLNLKKKRTNSYMQTNHMLILEMRINACVLAKPQ
jgi:hypothetical protein